ncbi:efflux RND transporter permease subunit [Acidisphaera sp. S103]|uniref:efflux RND transporter permease subunit n=1 Tax=Acidisphaera sp. S103 TaxID=1747223 RepID=UPI00131C6A85|nr:efflux RND transporter permease subunit [Acidisphaera sp. S103]
MNLSALFISRPVATTLLTIGITLAGIFAFFKLPVSPLPQVDFPTISVQAQLPGASPETVATSVASPLERHLGQIADVTEMTSTSSVGSARIILQFGLDRDINGAARDVQAAINAARADLPTSLRSNPTYRKVNPADAPVLILALTSKTLTRGQMYDAATNVLSQKLSQIDGIGQVIIGGAALPAVRVELNPTALFKYGIGLEDVRAALASANANSPKGSIDTDTLHYQLYTNDQASHADDYKPLVIAYRNGAAIRLSDVADVQDSVENLRNAGLSQGQPAVLVILFRQPGANIIDTVDSVKAAIPQLMAAMPADMNLLIANDRTTTIRASLHDTEKTLLISVALVTLVVFLFLRNARATLIPAIAVPVSIIGTFGTMYLMGYSLDNLSLMALTVSTGFVVDDAIVVLENISRHMEDGMPRVQAALRGAKEVGFTVVSMSLSLIAVFLPILLMGGIVGRLFREFAVTLSMAIMVSLAISLTTTPMMCALFLKPVDRSLPKRQTLFDRVQTLYGRTLAWSLRHPMLVILVLLAAVVLNVALYVVVPKGFFPQQDTGRMMGSLQADQSISFQAMQGKLADLSRIVQEDPAVQSVVGFTGAGGGGGAAQTNTGSVFVALKPLADRDGIDTVMSRLRRKLSVVPGARLFLVPIQDIRVGGRSSNAAYQYTLQADTTADLYDWAPKLVTALEHSPILRDVNSDQQQKGLETDLVIDRTTAGRLGINASQIDNTLYDAFGQRQVSTIYSAQNQYHVVMEVAPRYWQSPETLKDIYVSTAGGSASGTQTTNAVVGTVASATTTTANTAASIAASSARNASTNALANVGKGSASSGAAVSTSKETMIPLASFTTYGPGNTALAVNHQSSFVASTISFNLAPGKSLSDATIAVDQAMRQIGMPASIHGSFQGTAATFQESMQTIPILLLAALGAIYIVLGVLYESYVHPITILSTLPSAGIGAILFLMLFNIEFSLIAAIGVILLIGIVKKNAILMIDFALDAERTLKLEPREAIFEACLMRFRPIMMTTSAAMLGALPLALSFGDGGELRRPLGISIVGGLMVSQVLTLYTTPVVYLYLDRFRLAAKRQWYRTFPGLAAPEAAE